jgi:putative nucleotidyltransferase with HDIG domain
MEPNRSRASIFSQKLDRVALTSYFLGAVVPLVALGFITEDYVFPTLADPLDAAGLIALVASIAVLSFASFMILRRTTRNALFHMDRNNARLSSMLQTSGALAAAQDIQDAVTTATRCAQSLTGATAAYTLVRKEGGELDLAASAGDGPIPLWQAREADLVALAELAIEGNRPALREADEGAPAAAAVVIPGDRAALGAMLAVQVHPGERLDSEHVDALTTLAGLASVSMRNAELRDTQRNFYIHVTDILVSALDSHLGYQTGHGSRVAQLANRLGRAMGFDDDRLQRLHFGALLHDIGMLKFDRKLQMNRKVCEKHTVLGFRMLQRILLWQDIAPIVHHHHEWYDGSGYPEGLAGDAIPIEARVIALCDAFDAMTSESSYKMALPIEEALTELRQGARHQFDPQLVEKFVSLVESAPDDLPV